MSHNRGTSHLKKPTIKLYENKVEEQNTLSLVSTLVFGFSITLMVESDESVFIGHEELAYVFGISLTIVIVCSALSTLVLMGTSFIFRRYMFRQSLSSLNAIKSESLTLRTNARKMVYASFIGLFINLGAYGHAKWNSIGYEPLYIMTYIVLGIGFIFLGYIWFDLKRINEAAYSKLGTATSSRKLNMVKQSSSH
eukprot:205406_1